MGNHAQFFLPITLPSLWVLKHFYLTICHYDHDFNLLPITKTASAFEVFKLLYCACCQCAMESIIQKPTSFRIVLCPYKLTFLPWDPYLWDLKFGSNTLTQNHGQITTEEWSDWIKLIMECMTLIGQWSKYLGVWYISFSMTKLTLAMILASSDRSMVIGIMLPFVDTAPTIAQTQMPPMYNIVVLQLSVDMLNVNVLLNSILICVISPKPYWKLFLGKALKYSLLFSNFLINWLDFWNAHY